MTRRLFILWLSDALLSLHVQVLNHSTSFHTLAFRRFSIVACAGTKSLNVLPMVHSLKVLVDFLQYHVTTHESNYSFTFCPGDYAVASQTASNLAH